MIEFDVNMKAGDLYDYMLRHTYSGFSGLFGSVVGMIMMLGANYVSRKYTDKGIW